MPSKRVQPVARKTSKLLPVGNQPICNEQQFRRIDPVWCRDPVPQYFWQDRQNRRNYVLWLGWKLGFRKMQDWYRLNSVGTKRKWVARLTNVYSSFVDAVRECHPEYDWQEWRFPKVRRAFWSIPSNRQRYLLWLGEKLGFRQMEDWYSLKQKDVIDNHGLRPWQQYWRSSAFAAVKECFPKHHWHEWLFGRLAEGFWDLAAIAENWPCHSPAFPP